MKPYSEDEVRQIVSRAKDDWGPRWDVIKEWRDIRYGRDDVITTIPEELRTSDFEYHSSEFDDAVNELTSFLSAAVQAWTASPGKDRDQSKAEDIVSVINEVFKADGILEREAGQEVLFNVIQNQVENGQGVFKFTLKRDYPLRMPSRHYADEESRGHEYEENPDYNPKSRKETREERKQTKYRETDSSLRSRRQKFMEDEFAWQWRSVDPLNNGYFRITKDGVLVMAGEIAERPLSSLDQYDIDIKNFEEDYVLLGSPSEGGTQRTVTTMEAWDSAYCYFGIVSAKAGEGGAKSVEVVKKWPHPYGRPPYYEATGLVSTENTLKYRWTGAFGKMISEIPLLNHLETFHYNSIERGYMPLYQPVKDPAYSGDPNPLDTVPLVGISQSDAAQTELPPGWRWEVMPSGIEPDLLAQLQAARERVENSAVVSVLRGASPSAADSGVKISLLINSAMRSISPFTRHLEGALEEMAETFLAVNKRLLIDTYLTQDITTDRGRTLVKPLILKAEDIVTTKVDLHLEVELPVDKAAKENQGLTLINSQMRSYESAAPEYLGVSDPRREKTLIALEKREAQIDDVAFQAANNRFLQFEPAIFQSWFGNVAPAEPPNRTSGGGPMGAYGGGATEIGRGEAASPSAVQTS